jgi:hypothetical protein
MLDHTVNDLLPWGNREIQDLNISGVNIYYERVIFYVVYAIGIVITVFIFAKNTPTSIKMIASNDNSIMMYLFFLEAIWKEIIFLKIVNYLLKMKG